MLPLIYYPDPVLKQVCQPVGTGEPNSPVFDGEEVDEFLAGMCRSLYGYQGRGIAAPQCNWPVRVFIIMMDEAEPICYINPEILEVGKELILTREQCLSIPTISAQLRRPRLVRVKYQDTEGREQERMLMDDEAIAFQHELDHLNGITIFERMGSAQKTLKKKRYSKWLKKTKSMTQGNLQKLPRPKQNG